jgi:hypothetical protein
MTTIEPGVGSSGLVSRVKGMIMSPATEWDRIDAEPATVKGLYTGYVCIVAAIPAIAGVIGGLLFGMAAFGVAGPMFLVPAIVGAIIGYIGSLISVAVVAMIIDALAPSFDATKSQIQAFKVAAYAFTPAWVAGILAIVPMIGWLGMLVGGLYSLYVLYLGQPKLMRAPEQKAMGYVVVTIIVAIVVQWVIFALSAMIVGMATASFVLTGAAASSALYH